MSQDVSQSLVERLATADPGALGELFACYEDRLRRMIELRLDRRLSGRISPSDVIQDVYLDAAKRLRHFGRKPGMTPLLWLRLVANQRLVEVHRRHLGAQVRAAGQEISIDQTRWMAASSICLAAHLAGADTSPSQAAIQGERLSRLEAALEAMDPIDREILTLRHFEELTNGEVAEVLGIDKSAASKRYMRALVRLKESLESLSGFADPGD